MPSYIEQKVNVLPYLSRIFSGKQGNTLKLVCMYTHNYSCICKGRQKTIPLQGCIRLCLVSFFSHEPVELFFSDLSDVWWHSL